MRPDHDDVAIGYTSLMEMVGQGIGSFINLFVCESSLGRFRSLGLDYTDSIRMLLGIPAEVFLNRASVARPIEVSGGIGQLSHVGERPVIKDEAKNAQSPTGDGMREKD